MSLRPRRSPAHCGPQIALPPLVRDDRRAALEVHAGNGQDLGRRVDEDGNVSGLAIWATASSAIGPEPGPLSAVR